MNKEKATDIDELAKALFIINRHAKTALNPRELYTIKKDAITKLLKNNDARKIGLHFSDRPKLSRQHSTLLVEVGNYYFHIPPNKQDFKEVEHLGNIDKNYRNPKTQMSLSQAKRIVCGYLGVSVPKEKKTCSTYYTPSSLGRWNQSYFKSKRKK